MAIFSQETKETMVDFRKHNNPHKSQRSVPYLLPDDLKTKLTQTMKELGLDTGSIDLIHAKDGNYYFLEVNPIGQFTMTSWPCNYYLEKLIATTL